MSEHRSELIREASTEPESLVSLMKRWEPDDEVRETFLFDAQYAYRMEGLTYQEILKALAKEFPQSPLNSQFTEKALMAMIRNADLYDLIDMGVLESDYPFIINLSQELINEISFYHITKGDVVAEIGAGNGAFSLVLSMMVKGIILADQVYWNRKNRNFLKEKNIRHGGVPLGKKPDSSRYEKYKQRKINNKRFEIEGKFGQVKLIYRLDDLFTRLPKTTMAEINLIFLTINILKASH